VVSQQNANIADAPQLRHVSMGTIFWLSVYGVHIGATWRIQLNRLCVAARWSYVRLLWPLAIIIMESGFQCCCGCGCV